MSDGRESRGGFGPVVLLGLASGVGAAVGGNQTWVAADAASAGADSAFLATATGASVPLATALALVVLASWGVVLVSRGRVRRVVAVLGVVAALGTLATHVTGFFSAAESLRDDFARAGFDNVEVDHTRWFWVGLACAVVSVLATLQAVRKVPQWPEMGTRYDAPGEQGLPQSQAQPAEEPSSLDLWRAIDEGHDPTR
ncbi:MAG: Trp biosynthesis-associated membrane protein [Nocardioides sp.]|nr:Trp biosynthesis-associated membrane protein [Nocardioides sp.]